jgi:hypothetical protein
MEPVTYDLRNGASDSAKFYLTLARFSDEALAEVERQAGGLLTAYGGFVAARGEAPRSRGEYAVELLTLGVAWQRYGRAALACRPAIARLCSLLFRLRRRSPRLKRIVDPWRGRLASRHLLPGVESGSLVTSARRREPAGRTGAGGPPACDLRSFRRLLRWLDASGEFKDEVKRLRQWQALGESRGGEFFGEVCRAAEACSGWFAAAARRELGAYTAGVERFLRERHPGYVDREDRIFCGKAEVEYHLCLLSSELTNRGLREDYRRTPRKVVLLPACMRRSEGPACQARPCGEELRCAECSGRCAIGRVTALGRQARFDARIVVHSSSFTRSLLGFRDSTQEGVVAVACALNIVPGGYEMRELRIPSQCVLLDYCGCRKHWHPRGIATDLDDRKLLQVVGGR